MTVTITVSEAPITTTAVMTVSTTATKSVPTTVKNTVTESPTDVAYRYVDLSDEAAMCLFGGKVLAYIDAVKENFFKNDGAPLSFFQEVAAEGLDNMKN